VFRFPIPSAITLTKSWRIPIEQQSPQAMNDLKKSLVPIWFWVVAVVALL
jgi:hypothetical protein